MFYIHPLTDLTLEIKPKSHFSSPGHGITLVPIPEAKTFQYSLRLGDYYLKSYVNIYVRAPALVPAFKYTILGREASFLTHCLLVWACSRTL